MAYTVKDAETVIIKETAYGIKAKKKETKGDKPCQSKTY